LIVQLQDFGPRPSVVRSARRQQGISGLSRGDFSEGTPSLALSNGARNALGALRSATPSERMVAISRKARKDLRAAVAGDADPAEWQNLRAAVLCIGIGEYEVLECLPNAVRDAQALCGRVNALPHCRAKLLTDLTDRRAIQRGIRNFLKELQKAPPDTVFVHYSGHGMQRGGTVYMLPGDADLGDSACDPDADFLPIRDIFKYFREDLDMLARMLNPPRQVTFVLVVDACRVAEMDQATLSSSLEPPPGSAPVTWALCFSCSRLDGVGRPAGGTQPICTGAPRRESGHLCSGRATQGGPGGGGSADEREAPGSGSDAGGIAQYPGGLVLLYFPG
jgi:hypothetical protein